MPDLTFPPIALMTLTRIAIASLVVCGCALSPESRERPAAQPGSDFSTARSPTLLAPGVISSGEEEYRITFTPDGGTAYFGRAEEFFPVSNQAWIYESRLVEGEWTPPVVAPFSGEHSDIDPFISPDGERLYFSSIRPVDGVARRDADVWMVERTADGWSEPVHLGAPVNSAADDLYPSVDAAGTLYVGSRRSHLADGPGKWSVWRFERSGGEYLPGIRLGTPVNSDDPQIWEFNPAISPDGRTLVFTRLHLDDQVNTSFGELYVSHFRGRRWSEAENIGEPVNTPLDEFHPSFSADGRTLYFVRRDPTAADAQGDLFQISVDAVEALR